MIKKVRGKEGVSLKIMENTHSTKREGGHAEKVVMFAFGDAILLRGTGDVV